MRAVGTYAGFAARILGGAGYAVTSPGLRRAFESPLGKARGRSAERRILIQSTPCGAGALGEGRAPLGAPSRRFLSPGPYFRARTEGIPPTLIRAAFAALHPRRVQPSKAVPRSGDGRLPGASRVREVIGAITQAGFKDVLSTRPEPHTPWNLVVASR